MQIETGLFVIEFRVEVPMRFVSRLMKKYLFEIVIEYSHLNNVPINNQYRSSATAINLVVTGGGVGAKIQWVGG